jgi:hypothetical protein
MTRINLILMRGFTIHERLLDDGTLTFIGVWKVHMIPHLVISS